MGKCVKSNVTERKEVSVFGEAGMHVDGDIDAKKKSYRNTSVCFCTLTHPPLLSVLPPSTCSTSQHP